MQSLSLAKQLNLLDLYSEEICARIAQNFNLEKLGPLKELLHREQLEVFLATYNGLIAAEVRSKNKVDQNEKNGLQEDDLIKQKEEAERTKRMLVAEEVWEQLKQSELRGQLYAAVLEFLNQIDEELHGSICVERYSSEFVVGFSKLLRHSPALISLIATDSELKNWNNFTEILRKVVHGFNTLVDPLKMRVSRGDINLQRAMKVLLRSIPISNINGYEHLLHAISNCGSNEASDFVELIYPDFHREYEYLNSSAINRNQFFYVVRSEDNLSEIIKTGMKNDEPPPNANVLNTRLGNVPKIHIRACNIDLCKENPINLRPYQKELTSEAIEGRNVIICAPTGSGKTIVGAYIIREHLLKHGPQAKACFIVPTNALVDQQSVLFNKYMGHFAKVRGLSGSNEMTNPINSVIEHADLVVITPQLLKNELERKPLVIEESSFRPIKLDIFSLIIFDESHHSKDEHPYNGLMVHYHHMKQTGAHLGKLPQIIGMTASLGIGGSASKNLDEAVRYTLEICANMDAQWISCVRRYRDNLREYMPIVVEEIKLVKRQQGPGHECPFMRSLMREIDLMKCEMNKILEDIKAELSLNLDDSNGRDPLKQAFEHWLCNLRQELKRTELPDSSREQLMFFVEQLLLLYYTIDFLNLFGPKTALYYCRKAEPEILNLNGAKKWAANINQWLDALELTRGQLKNSLLLDALISTINEQFAKVEDSRVLIFLKQRDQCEILSKLLTDQTQYRTDFFTGQASREEGGQNAKIQKAKLDDFKEGRIKVLCATTVAEEGIDISACNLIIHYNYVTNEIARVQRRGRGRKKDARSLLLTCDKAIKDKEEQNELRERLMHDALEELAHWPRAAFQQKVSLLVEEMNRKRKEKLALEQEKNEERRKFDADYEIVCTNCNKILCRSTALAKVGSTYVIADREFWVRTQGGPRTPLPPEKATGRECRGMSPHIGEHRCSCNKKLGRIVQYRGGILLPNLKTESIAFVHCKDNSKRFSAQKWSKVIKDLFIIENITSLQLAEMKSAPNRPESLLQYEENLSSEILTSNT